LTSGMSYSPNWSSGSTARPQQPSICNVDGHPQTMSACPAETALKHADARLPIFGAERGVGGHVAPCTAMALRKPGSDNPAIMRGARALAHRWTSALPTCVTIASISGHTLPFSRQPDMPRMLVASAQVSRPSARAHQGSPGRGKCTRFRDAARQVQQALGTAAGQTGCLLPCPLPLHTASNAASTCCTPGMGSTNGAAHAELPLRTSSGRQVCVRRS
ncbi:hypothetical protein ABPG77_006142, partial [Micractinium sp. CCAP 211/92]